MKTTQIVLRRYKNQNYLIIKILLKLTYFLRIKSHSYVTYRHFLNEKYNYINSDKFYFYRIAY
jgi:hypothetical protein